MRRLVLAVLLLGMLGALAARAEEPTVEVSVDTTGPTTRVVLTHSSIVRYEIRAGEGAIEIVYAGDVRLEPSGRRVDDTILERIRLRDDRRIVLTTGPDYRGYETFELRNPMRIILDLQGGRGQAADAPPVDSARRGAGGKIIVIDPGHGGVESGAIGPSGIQEKDVTLDLARRLREALRRKDRLDVVLTREDDRLVGLDERAAIANHNRADLFLSIHLNSSPRANAQGAETYYLATEATDDEARTLAALENDAASAAVGARAAPGSPGALDLVLWDLAQNQYLAESSALAESVQRRLNELAGTRNRGVRQAPFRVLMGATMPSILVEVGFVSSPAEEEKLRTAAYREQIVEALTGAIQDYLARVDRATGPAGRAGGPGTR